MPSCGDVTIEWEVAVTAAALTVKAETQRILVNSVGTMRVVERPLLLESYCQFSRLTRSFQRN